LTARDDQGEYQWIQGFITYPWEALGQMAPNGPKTFSELSDDDIQYKSAYSKYEPVYDDLVPFNRYQEYKGYLGQASIRQVCLPEHVGDDFSATPNPLRLSSKTVLPGVFREHIGLDGAYHLASAKSVSITKRVLIPIPKQIKLPEDKEGDNEKNYKASGATGQGAEHTLKDFNPAKGSDLSNLQELGRLDDREAYEASWKQLLPFLYHEKDYTVPAASALPITQLQKKPDFTRVPYSQWLNSPEGKNLKVDHRTTVEYKPGKAGLFLTPEGFVVIRDAYGAEIVMGGGSIMMSCPGDIWRMPGRSCLDWSGDDHVIKANNSVDITSSNKDVRVKAEVNLEMLSGNSGDGRMLLENRATTSTQTFETVVGEDIRGSGIILKAANSQVVAYGNDLYFRSLAGGILVDANQGSAPIRTLSSTFIRHIGTSAIDAFPQGDDKTQVNVFTANTAEIGSSLSVDGRVVVMKNGMLVKDSIEVVDGHIYTEKANSTEGKVIAIENHTLDLLTQELSNLEQTIEEKLTDAKNDYTDDIDAKYYQVNQVGSSEAITGLQFSMRNEEQYNTTVFVLPEPYWQQMARGNSESAGKTWSEPVILYQGQELMPYPGKVAWSIDSSYRRSQLELYDHDAGVDSADLNDYKNYTNILTWEPAIVSESFAVMGL
jgi:hypothetical protein